MRSMFRAVAIGGCIFAAPLQVACSRSDINDRAVLDRPADVDDSSLRQTTNVSKPGFSDGVCWENYELLFHHGNGRPDAAATAVGARVLRRSVARSECIPGEFRSNSFFAFSNASSKPEMPRKYEVLRAAKLVAALSKEKRPLESICRYSAGDRRLATYTVSQLVVNDVAWNSAATSFMVLANLHAAANGEKDLVVQFEVADPGETGVAMDLSSVAASCYQDFGE